ncbi:TPA: O-antigen polysaccharide polymerase Wzy [Clostridium perfringens]|uniref:O-antigen polysaccharide polymerase Wzy n=1 Tax=Clostridium perfringens TaxID=1502 RepID=A0A8H9R0Y4_CLOPF|nr:O-antigen polysaccharide polymerase Wzy [Clostridium perfringens]
MKNKKIIAIIVQIILLIATLIFFYQFNCTNNNNLKLLCNVVTLEFIFCILIYYYCSGTFICGYTFFIISFFIFQFGQYMLYGLGIDYGFYVINRYSFEILNSSLKFSTVSLLMFNLGVLVTINDKLKWTKIDLNLFSSNCIKIFIKKLFIISLVIVLPITIIQGIKGWSLGYSEFRNLEFLGVFSILELVFVPISILTMLCEKNKKKIIFIKVILVIYSMFVLFTGDRTNGIATIIVIILYDILENKCLNTKVNFKNKIKLVTIVISIVILIPTVANLRGVENKGLDDIANVVEEIKGGFLVDTLGEMGYSISPMLMVKQIMPNVIEFKLGESYFATFLSLIPNSLDFTGVVERMIPKVSLDLWLQNQYGLNFGAGFSIIAEAYYNFGQLGVLAMFVIGVLVGKLIAYNKSSVPKGIFDKYVKIVMVYALFTLGRRQFYFLFKQYIYIVLMIILILYLYKKIFIRTIKKY